MPDKYTKFLMHGNADRTGLTLSANTPITTEQKVVGSHSAKLVSSDQSTVEWTDSDDFVMGTSNWTVEGWYRFTATSTYQSLWGQVASDTDRVQFGVKATNTLTFYARAGGVYAADYEYTWNYSLDTWYHVALVRNGSSVLLFIDGDLKTWTTTNQSIGTNEIKNVAAPFRLGFQRQSSASRFMDGYADGLRLSIGVACYTANFTPETERFDSDQYTKILFYADDIADVSDSEHYITGATDILYSAGKFNNCPYFDGNDYLYTEPSSDWNIGSQDFTIEAWVKFSSVNSHDILGYKGANNDNVWRLYTGGTGTIKFKSTHAGSDEINITTTPSPSLSTGTWYHIACVRQGSAFRIYLNGENIGGGTDSSALHYYDGVGKIQVGMVDSSYYMNGYIDEVKFSVGIARYNNDFTPPTRPEADFKVEGSLSKAATIYLIDESTNVLERVGEFNSGNYDFVYVSSGHKFVAARANDDGEGKAFGDIVPATLSGSELFVDRFTGTDNSAPNSSYWSVANTHTFINSNKLRQSTSGSSTDVHYITTLTGNFDVEIDFSVITDTTNSWSYLMFSAKRVSDSVRFEIGRIHDSGGVKYRSNYNDGSDHPTDVSISDTSGKLKICRFGSTVHLYRWNGSSWVSDRNNTEDASGGFEIHMISGTADALTVDWDNFIRYAVL